MLKKLPQDRIEEESIAAVATICHSRNWDFNVQVKDKSGIDAEIEVVHGISRTGIFLKCQVKAGLSYISSETDEVLKIRIETKYLRHWHDSNVQVALLFYDPRTQTVYWKDIRDYLRVHAILLSGTQETRVVEFHKKLDLLSFDSLPILEQVALAEFHYGFINLEEDATEVAMTNLFPACPLPAVWVIPTVVSDKSYINERLQQQYAYTVNDGLMYSFADIRKRECELVHYCDRGKAAPRIAADVPPAILTELLNICRDITMFRRGLERRAERYFFPLEILRTPSANKFKYTSLQGKQEERTLIYLQNHEGQAERKHHAVKISFVRLEPDTLLQIEPDWHFTFPQRMPPAERRARLISEKAAMHNKDYLYLLHFWRQYLSHNTDRIRFLISSNPVFGTVEYTSSPIEYALPFRMANDYFGPKRAAGQNA